MTTKKIIREGLAPMIQRARDKGKWLRSVYHGLWFSPDELEAHHNNGRFLWGPINWRLGDPQEHLIKLEQRAEETQDEVTNFKRRLEASFKDTGR